MAAIETETSFSNTVLKQGNVAPPPPMMQIKIAALSMMLAAIASAAPSLSGQAVAAIIALILFASLVSSFMKADRAAECWRQGHVVEKRAQLRKSLVIMLQSQLVFPCSWLSLSQ